MKCIKKGAVAKRVSDGKAKRLVAQGWSYCDKAKWRNSMKEKETDDATV